MLLYLKYTGKNRMMRSRAPAASFDEVGREKKMLTAANRLSKKTNRFIPLCGDGKRIFENLSAGLSSFCSGIGIDRSSSISRMILNVLGAHCALSFSVQISMSSSVVFYSKFCFTKFSSDMIPPVFSNRLQRCYWLSNFP